MPMPRSLRLLVKSRQWISASERAQETPRIIRLPSSRRTPMAMRVAQSPDHTVDTDFVVGGVEVR